jgi:fatty-acyl-CoA synthase
MQAHAVGTSTEPLVTGTIGDLLDQVTSHYANSEALVSVHQGTRYTYSDLKSEVDRIALGLIASGVERGERVGIWSPSCAQWVITQYAVAKVGAILVTINPAFQAREIEHALSHVGVSTLVLVDRFLGVNHVEMLAGFVPGLVTAAAVGWRSPRLPLLRSLIYINSNGHPGGLDWEDLARMGRGLRATQLRERAAACEPHDAAAIIYTSGTTGGSKGATLSHHTIVNCGMFVGKRLHYTERDRICVPVPLCHVFGCVLGNIAALTHGATIVLPGNMFEARACLRTIQDERCTSFYGVPSMFSALLNEPRLAEYHLDSLRTGITAGAVCPETLFREAITRLHVPQLTVSYGMTEAPPIAQSHADDSLESRTLTAGSLLPHVECRIVRAGTARIVERGEPGELCVRGYGVMLRYWDDEAATASVIDEDRWMHTGDLAIMRENGNISIVGRLKDMIIRAGENISPTEIEEVLHRYPGVQRVHVVGVPDTIAGEAICAWIQLKDGGSASVEDIRRHCRGELAPFKIPRYIRFTNEFPTTVTGKIQRHRMREISVEEY